MTFLSNITTCPVCDNPISNLVQQANFATNYLASYNRYCLYDNTHIHIIQDYIAHLYVTINNRDVYIYVNSNNNFISVDYIDTCANDYETILTLDYLIDLKSLISKLKSLIIFT